MKKKQEIIEALEQLKVLLELEREEDHKEYERQIRETPLHERKDRGLTWYPVSVADTSVGVGGNLVVAFERVTKNNHAGAFQSGDVVALFANSEKGELGSRISGVIVAVWNDRMKVSFKEDDLPDWVDDGKLGIDRMFDSMTYREMDRALAKLIAADGNRLEELRHKLYGGSGCLFGEMPTYLNFPNLNASQNEAVQQVVAAQDLAIIHGPPGTGKTTTMVQAIHQVVKLEGKVMVTAPSNVAVDLLCQRLAAKGLSVVRIGNPARVSEELQKFTVDHQLSEHPEYKLVKKWLKDSEEIRKMARKYKRNFGRDEREQRKLLIQESKRMKADAKKAEEGLLDKLLDEAQVIAATLVGATHPMLGNRRFKTVFIDEAGQALEPATWIPILKADKVVMAGDHSQLPPTVKSREAAKGGLEISLFERAITTCEADTLLDTQYRMDERIMGFSSQEFYEGKLKAGDNVKVNILEGASNDAPSIEFIDTAGCGFEEKRAKGSSSYENQEEANLIRTHLQQLSEENQILQHGNTVGVISPYSGQVALLRQMMVEENSLTTSPIAVKSIDGFQGQEKDIIYISLVRSNEDSNIGFLADTRRMNVAITRAKKKLVLIGDSATIGANPFYERFLAYVEKYGAYRSAYELMY